MTAPCIRTPQTVIPCFDTPVLSNPAPGPHHRDEIATTCIHLRKGQDHDADTADMDLEFELAGPREQIYFDPSRTRCALVTCGGLCPGINNVIRATVMCAHYTYGVQSVVGIRFGLEGFIPAYGHPVEELTPQRVADIHLSGGTILGTSRGPQSASTIVDTLQQLDISILFMIGGDGTMRAAQTIAREIMRRKLHIALVGIPKTIDNDINFVARTFGFDTAVEAATQAIQCAHTEATGVFNGIGIVKLMGRESGFIAAQASLAFKEVNFVLVPEVPFVLEGKQGLLPALKRRLEKRGHAVLIVAEGAGQDLLHSVLPQKTPATDVSGNSILGDICALLRTEIVRYCTQHKLAHAIKYIDPSYIIRSVAANANDRIYCGFLGQHAVHAAMAGKTSMVISEMRGQFVHLPLSLVTQKRRTLDTASDYWRAVMESTGQLAPVTI